MIKLNTNDAQIDEKEVTAYIQQQMAELTPHLEEQTAVQVKLTPVDDGYEAEVTAHHPDGDVQTIGWHEDLFDAIKNAKEGLLEYIVETEDEMNPRLREEKIQHLRRNGNLYLH